MGTEAEARVAEARVEGSEEEVTAVAKVGEATAVATVVAVREGARAVVAKVVAMVMEAVEREAAVEREV